MTKPKVLFVTQTLGYKIACGVGLYGQLWSDALVKSSDLDLQVLYTDSLVETIEKITMELPDIVVYNFHYMTNPWMADSIFKQSFPNIKHVAIQHDLMQDMIDNNNFNPMHHGDFDYFITANPTLRGNDKVHVVNKLIPCKPTVEYTDVGCPIIGYQGFGFNYKGILRLAYIVNEEFDECIFRLHMVHNYYSDRDGSQANQRINEVMSVITKPGIKLEFTHDMLSTQDLVNWLAQNTINCYLYDYPNPAGLASSPDYALAAKRPITVSDNHMMMHFYNLNPSVIIHKPYTIRQIIENGTAPLEPLYQAYSEENFLNDWKNAIKRILVLG